MTRNEIDTVAGETRRDQAVDASRLMRERMLAAMHKLESALGVASFSREQWWQSRVADALSVLSDSMDAQFVDLTEERGLFAELIAEEPRMAPRVQRLRDQYEELKKQVTRMSQGVSGTKLTKTSGVKDVRQELSQLLSSLRQFQYEEANLIFEAIQVDIGPQD